MISDAAYTVLFVDDEPSILRSMSRLFRGAHFDVLTTESAEQALEIMRGRRVEVLVTDYRMPGMSGLELLREVRSLSPNTIRVMISGHSDINVVLAALNEGELFRFVTKPWNDLELKVTVNLALAHRKLIDEKERLFNKLKQYEQMFTYVRQTNPALLEAAELYAQHEVLATEQEGAKHVTGNQ